MVNLYQYHYTEPHRCPNTGFLAVVEIEMTISKGELDEFTRDAIARQFLMKEVFSQHPAYNHPMNKKDAIILNYNRQSDELQKFKEKLHELDFCEYNNRPYKDN